MEQIIAIHCDDGVVFNSKGITATVIKKGAAYEGVRVKIEANLGVMQRRIQVDIGFSGVIVPGPVETDFPVILDFPAPRIKSYSIESAIAEKFEAIVKLDFQTSRMKDFYDIHFIASTIRFERKQLKKALLSTFKDRGTDTGKIKVIFDDGFKQNAMKQEQWRAFLRKNELEFSGDFETAIEKIERFLVPLFDGNLDQKHHHLWNCEKWEWQRESLISE